jgi:thiamine-monophosphate kinase
LRTLCARPAPEKLVLGIGDDAAAWRPSRSAYSVISTDALVEGVHFTRDVMSAAEVGHRALASNLSDLAAMGARPVLATIAFGVAPGADDAWILEFYRGLTELATRTRCAIAGGDIVRAPAITVSITVVGEVRPTSMKRRSTALAHDVLAVTGPLGASRAGLLAALDRPDLAAAPVAADALATYRTPEPRLAEGRFFAASRNVHAMMDLSDGIATDLARMAEASGLGAIVDAVPIAPSAQWIAERSGSDAVAFALSGGEDYELLVAIDRRAFGYLASRFAKRFGRPLHRVGAMTEGSGVRLAYDGSERMLSRSGWDHLRG